MKTNTRFWSYLAHFLLGWEMFQIKVVEKTKTHFVFSNFFFKTCRLWDKAEKYCRTWQATDDCGACALHGGYLRLHTHTHTHTHSLNMQYSLLFHYNNGYANAPQCYVIRTLPVASCHEVDTDLQVVPFELDPVSWQWSRISGMLHRVAGLIIADVSNEGAVFIVEDYQGSTILPNVGNFESGDTASHLRNPESCKMPL